MTRFLIVSLLLTGSAATAAAQGSAPPPSPSPQTAAGTDIAHRGRLTPQASPADLAASDCARARQRGVPCVLIMDREDILGGSPTGDGTLIPVRRYAEFTSLIRLRTDFRAEIIRAGEEL